MEQEAQAEQQKPAKPELTDIGTRYEHLADYRDALEACVEILKKRGVNTLDDKQRLAKLCMAYEVLKATLDSHSGINDYMTEYSLYKQINSIPNKAEEIQGGRGTPLC